MSILTGSQIVIEELIRNKVEYVFGYPGGAAINLFDALYDSPLNLILTRHEQGAIHMADGCARSSGKLGVVLVTSGPGVLNTMTGLLTAKKELVSKSKRPLLLVGNGAVISNAYKEVRTFVKKFRIPVTNTLLGKGVFPESHEMSLGMLGMHGTAYANYATTRCDLIISIGSRFDDRINGKTDEFCPLAKKNTH